MVRQDYMYYGGWGHCNMVKLAPDLLSIVPFEDGTLYKEVEGVEIEPSSIRTLYFVSELVCSGNL